MNDILHAGDLNRGFPWRVCVCVCVSGVGNLPHKVASTCQQVQL